MTKKRQIYVVFIITAIITFCILFFNKADSDLVWNFGFSYNTANLKLMYKDFNMVISPLYPFITGLFMFIFGNNFIVFTIINTIYILLILYVIYKINDKIYLFSIPFILVSCLANYNTLCILFALTLIYFEKEKKNDYLIGFIIALAFLTKINAGIFLLIPSLYYFKDFKKILKRFIGFIIPNIVVIIIFLFMNNLKNYISYVFLGLFDFAKNNLMFSYIALIIPLILLFLIYLFKKEKNVIYLYGICFLFLVYPIMNDLHVIIAVFPALILIFNKYHNIAYQLKYFSLILTLIPIIGLYINTKELMLKNDENIFKVKKIEAKYIDGRNSLKRYFNDDFSNVTLLLYDNYLYKLLLNLEINKYDIILYGNLGYKGTEKMINYLKSKEKNQYFVLDTNVNGTQYNYDVSNFVKNNFKEEVILDNFIIYKKEA